MTANFAKLISWVERFDRGRILLVGDLMLDQYIFGDAERISPEAPVPVLRIVERQERVGGAGSVALNLAALGTHVHMCGVVGTDDAAGRVRRLLEDAGIATELVTQLDDRPTITKTRLVGLAEHRHRQQIIRVDDERVAPLPAEQEQRLLTQLLERLPDVDVLCLEDYDKGLLSSKLCATLIAAARDSGTAVLVDPARTSDWSRYAGATAVTPNRAEFEMVAGGALSESDLVPAAQRIAAQHDIEQLVITLGRDGALLVPQSGAPQRFPTTPRAVYDNTGAGDAVLAMLAVAVAAGAPFEDAVPLANIAGGLEVSKFGCVPIARDEVLSELHAGAALARGKVRELPELLHELQARRARGESVVFTNGCFDILHPGHIDLLRRARAAGSLLVVGLNSDASVRAQGKGDDRPIRREADRAVMLEALECVDYVVTFDTPDPLPLIEAIVPDVLIKGSDWAGKGVVGQATVERSGGRVLLLDLVNGYSTTGELERIRSSAPEALR